MFKTFFLSSLFLFSFSYAQQDLAIEVDNAFITKFEYGKMLYNNPRGIGCSNCHGKKAEGKKLVSFTHEYDNKTYKCELWVPSIRNVTYRKFSRKINSKKNPPKKFKKTQVCEKLIYYSNVMPTYFLVEEEIQAIYHYVTNLK